MRNALGILLVTLATGVSTHFAFQLERAGAPSFWAFALGPTVLLASGAAVRAHADGELLTWLRPVWGDFTRGVFGALMVFLAAYVFSRWCAGTPRESWLARLYLQVGDPKMLKEQSLFFAGGVIVAALAEELVWRGLVTSLFKEVIGERWAWVAAAFAYAAANLPTVVSLRDPEAGYNPVLVVAAVGAGLVWGAMTRRFGGRLVPVIIAHAMFDWVVLFTFRLWGNSI